MNTSSVVTEIVRMNPDWTRPNVLDIINNIVKMALKRDLESQIYFDTTTGDLPYLTTTAGTYKYTPTISNVTFWRIKWVLCDVNNITDNRPLWDQSGLAISIDNADYDREYQNIKIAGKYYTIVPIMKVSENGTTAPYVVFRFDPGTTTTKYRFAGLQSPTEITSEAVTIPFDDSDRYSFMIPAVLTMIDALENGRYQQGVEYIEKVLLPKISWGAEKDFDRVFVTNSTY